MKHRYTEKLVLCLSFLLSGCELLFQAGPGLSGRAYEEYQKSIKPYIAYWTKDGMTEDGRLRNWVECGGSNDGSFSPYIGLLNKERRPEEKDRSVAHYRLDNELQRCMLRSGYRYIGDCSSIYMKSQPLCGAP